MSVVASYARMMRDEVETLRVDPGHYWRLAEMPWDLTRIVDVGASERLYLDKEWQVLSWLCSPRGRAEERKQAALIRVPRSGTNGEDLSRAEFEAAVARELAAMGFPPVDPLELGEDPVLTAIRGRRKAGGEPSVANLGLASATFAPDEVQLLAAALNRLEEVWLRERFDVGEMDVLGLPTDGEATELDEFCLPQLERLKVLYNRAAKARQHVVVVFE
jgi:hypothetical protein